MYEFTSSAANNGSGFEGLGDNTVPWNIATGLVMLLARFVPIVLPLAIAGSLAVKKPAPETSGSLSTDTPLCGGVLFGCVIIVGALADLPPAFHGSVEGGPESGEDEPDMGHGRILTLREMEERHIRRVLNLGVSLERAAELLGVTGVTLWRKRKELGLP